MEAAQPEEVEIDKVVQVVQVEVFIIKATAVELIVVMIMMTITQEADVQQPEEVTFA